MTAVAQPSGTVTLVFTDIEGSTRLLEELGTDAYREALAEHRRVVREACARHAGYEVDYEGDAFFYAFASAQAAVAAVSEAIAGLEGGPIRIRVGIHTGEPALDPPKYVGIDVHRAARIMSAAHGGQVVLSRETVDLLDGGFELRDLGDHRFKDVDAPRRIYQLGDREHPPLKSLYRITLPVPATAFLGREREVEAVLELLTDPDARLLTLTGPGGTGKTRLAIEAAGRAGSAYPDGTTWIPLAPLREPALALTAIADALGVRADPGLSLVETLASGLAGRQPLLVVDNAEHLLPELAHAIAMLRRAVPMAKILVTSRERLQLEGEKVYAVAALASDESVRLFLERAAALGVTLGETPAVGTLCEHLDHLPLALELAAARTVLFSPDQILERLDERLDLLAGGRDADPRQKTLRATIGWSHDLLDVQEQRLFRRLAVFVGGCTYEAAEQVAGADVDTLQSLLDQSLVRRNDDAGSPRFWMLETIREYAAEQLVAAGELADVEERHVDFYVRLVENGETALMGPDQPRWLGIFDAEAANWRAALQRVLDVGDDVRAAAIAAGLALYWWYRGLAEEGLPVFTALLGRGVADPRIRARVLLGAGDLAYYVDDREFERQCLVEAAALCESLDDADGAARACAGLVWSASSSGDPAGAARFADQALAAVGRAKHPWVQSYVFTAAHVAALDRGDHGKARRLARDALRLARVGGNPRSLWLALGSLAWHEIICENYEAARRFLTEARQVGDPLDREFVAVNEGNLALVEMMLGRPATAATHFRESLSAAPPGSRRIPGEALFGVAALVAAERPEAAVRLWSASVALHESCGAPLGPVLERIEQTTLTPLRSAFASPEFDLLWEAGRSLAAPAAIDLALAESESITTRLAS